jgi:protein involved in polysaccharide export with SLBB domain
VAGAGSENPALNDDDRLVVYKETDVDFKSDKVTIVGEVQRPGEYKAYEGMSLYDLIIQAGGPTNMAAGTVEVATPISDPESKVKASVVIYTLAEATDGTHRDEPLTPGMLLSIPRRAEKLITPMKVELKGQFKRPGVYALLYDDEPLKSLIERAGGFTENADPFGISLSRKKEQIASAAAREQLATVLNTMDQLLPPVSEKPNATLLTAPGVENLAAGTTDASLGLGDALLLVSPRRLKQMPTNNRIAFSLEDKESYLENIGSVHLADGDVIEVPLQSEVVQVLGAVQSPGPVFYVPGYSINDYIQRAGGGAPDADFNRAVIISISGAVQPLNKAQAINPGDVIVMASQHQVIQPPRHRSLFDTVTSLLGIAWVFRGFK